ncbi:RNA-directed DNA polymerase, eukaryota, reverse transcriptase zinc-binding domain protein [Tanacetum coccineum]
MESAKKEKMVAQDLNSSEPDYPPGFTPLVSHCNNKEGEEVNRMGCVDADNVVDKSQDTNTKEDVEVNMPCNVGGAETVRCDSGNDSSGCSKRDHVISIGQVMVHTHNEIKSWFSGIEKWSPQFEVKDRVVWVDVEGVPLKAWTSATFHKTANKWGDLVYMEDSNASNKYSMRLCIKTTVQLLIAKSFKVILEGKIAVVRAKEVTGWVPKFGLDDNLQQQDDKNVKSDKNSFDGESSHADDDGEEMLECDSGNDSSGCSKQDHVDSLNPTTKPLDSFSMLERFHEVISIGQAMGFGMKGCEKDYRRIINSNGRKDYVSMNCLSLNVQGFGKGEKSRGRHHKGCEGIFQVQYFPNRCNPSLISLIPKVIDAKIINEFRPISLIGCQYRIISKILANRLSKVVDELVSHEQSALIKGRQILDGLLILNEIISWCKARNQQALIFKVDFQKTYDSVLWDYLDELLEKFRFGYKWRGWIRGCLQSSKASILEVILKVSSKISKWKAKTLYVGGRLTLIKSVLVESERSLGCLRKQNGEKQLWKVRGYSLCALNQQLLFKWIWRFLNSQSGFWKSIIKAIYGPNGSLDEPIPRCSCGSVWVMIRKSIDILKSKGVDLMQFCNKVIRNGSSNSFLHERWNGDTCFKVRFLRLFNLELEKDIFVAQKLHRSYCASSFRRRPRGGLEESQ